MKKSEFKTLPVRKEVNIEYFCDWCDSRIKEIPFGEYNEFKLEQECSDNYYPEGGCIETRHVDLCKPCQDKVFILLEKEGLKIQTGEHDF